MGCAIIRPWCDCEYTPQESLNECGYALQMPRSARAARWPALARYPRSAHAALLLLWFGLSYALVRSGVFSLTFTNSTRYFVKAVPALEVAIIVAFAGLRMRGRQPPAGE